MPRTPLSTLFLLGLMVSAVLLAAIWWRAYVWYPILPDPFPIRFDAGGRPNRWVAKSANAWFMLPAIATGMTIFLGGITMILNRLAHSVPEMMNLPRKKLFVTLSPEGRAAVMGPTRTYLVWTTAAITAIFLWIVEGSARVAMQELTALVIWPLFAAVGFILIGLVPYVIATSRTIEVIAQRERSVD